MQYVMRNQRQIWNEQVLKANLTTLIPIEEEREWWRVWSGDEPLSEAPYLTFTVSGDGPFPDNYWFSSVLHLFSDRLVNILRQFNIKFECFSVKLVDRESGHDIASKYFAFRLLATRQCIDYDHSIIEEGLVPEIWKLALIPECQESAEPMFRLERFQYFMIVNSDLKAALEDGNITGFEFTPVDEFQEGMKVWEARNSKKAS